MKSHGVVLRRVIEAGILIFLLTRLSVVDAVALTADEKNNIEVYKSTSKGVVNITSIVYEYDFFYGLVPREGAGSGSIIDDRGFILTNDHVIKDARRIEVTLADGTKWQGKLVGTDPDNDLAVIQIQAPKTVLHVIELGRSADLQVGQKVLAIGNPFGLSETLTTGIISSLGRSIRSQNGALIEDLIQTDAAINPGNSGGPLLDTSGRMIGINTAIFSPTGASVGVGFAVPVDTARRIIPDLIEKGHVAHPWMGLSMFPIVPGVASALDLNVDRGVIVVEVARKGPADKAGIRGSTRLVQIGNIRLPVGGDVIVEIDGQRVFSSEDVVRIARKHRPGDSINLKILRNGKFMIKRLVLGERPR